MSSLPIGAVGGIQGASVAKPLSTNQAKPGSGPAGDNVFSKLIESANQNQVEADQAVNKLATGAPQSLHDVVISTAKADLSFRLVLEMRNKLTDAFQEIMRMQV